MLSIYVVPWLTGMLAISSFHGTQAHQDLIMGNMGTCPEPPQIQIGAPTIQKGSTTIQIGVRQIQTGGTKKTKR